MEGLGAHAINQGLDHMGVAIYHAKMNSIDQVPQDDEVKRLRMMTAHNDKFDCAIVCSIWKLNEMDQ